MCSKGKVGDLRARASACCSAYARETSSFMEALWRGFLEKGVLGKLLRFADAAFIPTGEVCFFKGASGRGDFLDGSGDVAFLGDVVEARIFKKGNS